MKLKTLVHAKNFTQSVIKAKSLLLLFLVMTSTIAHAQLTFKDAVQGGQPLNQLTMVQTKDEGTVIVRKSADTSVDFNVTKLNKDGVESWSKSYSMPGNTVSKISITENAMGKGFSLLFQPSGSQQLAVVKCDSLGNINWKKMIAVKDRPVNWSYYQTALITSTKDGGFFIAVVTDPYYLDAYYSYNRLILIRLDNNGDKLWHTSHERLGSGYDWEQHLDAISETADGGVIIAETYAFCEFYCYNTNIYGFDANGNNNLSRVIYGDGSTQSYSFNTLTVNQISTKGNKIRMIGNVANWYAPYYQRAYFELDPNVVTTTVHLLADNDFALADFLKRKSVKAMWGKSITQNKTMALFRNDGSIFKTESTWNQYDMQDRICPNFTVPAFDTASKKLTDLVRAYGLASKMTDSVIFSRFRMSVNSLPASVQVNCSGVAPGSITTVAAASVSTKEIKKQTVYPNPAKDILNIQVSGIASVSLINQSGKTLITATINNQGKLNIAHLPAGLYYLKNNATGAVQKVIVNK
jgi:hypothetical protein